MKLISPIVKIASTLCLLALSLTAQAQQWYHVELVVFERFSGAHAEAWPEMTNIRQGQLQPEMATSKIQPAANQTLTGVANKLRSASDYRVLYHQSWQQPVLSKSSAQSVQILSSDGLIEGVLELFKLTYLNADIDLWLKEKPAITNSWGDDEFSPTTAVSNPHLKQIRRIRSKELIYFDHPRVAAILKLTPVETPAAAVSNVPETYSLPASANINDVRAQLQ